MAKNKKARYKDIQKYVKDKHGFVPKTCWIADVKEKCGLPVKRAPNRVDSQRKNPCPKNKIQPIEDALKYFGLI